MYIIAIAWMYVALMMAVAEATNTNGTVLGAIVTFILYGLLPVALVVYLMRSPGRKRAIKTKEAEEAVANAIDSSSFHPDAASHAPAAAELDSLTSVREKS
jgi:mannose/fructose/N-acetylgalactosamine-specific phosphotransferase system component IID